jgi:outer membrane protein TolC
LLGLPLETDIEVSPPKQTPEVSVTVRKGLELANENNSQALQFRLNEIIARRDLEQATRQSLFSANLIANFGLNQTAVDFANLYNNPENRQFFTVGFEIPIFNWGKQRAEINAARNQQKAVANDIAYQQQLFDLQVQNTVRDFQQLRSQVSLAAKSDTIAIKRYDVTKNRYLIGKVDVTNLHIAQQERDTARRQFIQALRNFWSGFYDLRRLTLYDFIQDEPIYYEGLR